MISLDEMTAASASDPIAVTVLAAAKARAWCAHWGDNKPDSLEFMQQTYVQRPAAKRDLEIILSMSKQDRQALVNYILRKGKD